MILLKLIGLIILAAIISNTIYYFLDKSRENQIKKFATIDKENQKLKGL
jgi:hypothetical protein